MNNQDQIIKKNKPTFYFIGVTTKQSSIMKVFPLWMKDLGREEVVIEGWDCKIHDEPQNYLEVVAQIKNDPLALGALVTTHKIDLLSACHQMFDYLDPYAQITNEISSISKFWKNWRRGALLWRRGICYCNLFTPGKQRKPK